MEVSGQFAEVWEGLGGFGRVWEGLGGFGADWEGSGGSGTDSKGLGGFGRVWEGLEWFGKVWEGLGMPKMCSGHQKHVFGRGWEGLGRFERFWEVSGELGRVWKGLGVLKQSNCYRKLLFGRVWEDWAALEMPKVCNCHQIHRQRATQATQGAAKGCQRVPEDDNMDPIWSPNGGGGRAVTTDCSKKFAEKCKTPHPLLNTPKT